MNTFIRRSQWILLSLFVFLVLAVSVDAQIGGSPARRVARMSDAQAGSCTTARKGQIYFSTDSNGLFYCDGTNWVATGGGAGDALTTNPLSQFAATTSAQFAGVISDETGTGAVVLASGPTLTSPVIGTKVNLPRVTALPGTPSAGDTVIVTDDSAAGACDSAAGSAQSLCQYNGAAWVSLGDGSGSASAAGSDTQLQRNNAGSFGGISGATSDGTNVTFGSGNLRATRFRSTTSIDDANGNEVIITPATTSAVNEVTITNSATGNPVSIAASGGDANVDLILAGKGTGAVKIGGTATGLFGLLDTDQLQYLNITPGSNLTADRTLTITTGDAARTLTLSGDATLQAGTADTAIVTATTYYVCPSGNTNCAYDGDGGQSATPSDSNACTTKALPCATIAGARDKFTGKTVKAVVTIQLADTGADAYFPDNVEFENVTTGRQKAHVLEKAIDNRDDDYPSGYIWIHGNTATPANVKVTGAATAGGTTSTKKTAFASRGATLRVSHMTINYFRTPNADTGAINCYSALCYAETISATSDHTNNDGSVLSGFSGATLMIGGTWSVTNSGIVRANAKSTFQTYTPAGYASVTFSHSGTNAFALMANESSHGFVQGGTWSFSGAGTYNAYTAFTASSINFNGDATTSITINAANATFLHADTGSMISEGCGGSSTTCTFTSMLRRAFARNGSHIKYQGTTAGSSADFLDGGSTIANGSFPQNLTKTSTLEGFQDFKEISAPATPAANEGRLYVKDVAGASGLFFKNDAGTETQLGAAGSSPSIGGTLTSATAGSVLFAASGAFAQDNANLFFDDTNNRLGIGTASPTTKLDVLGTSASNQVAIIRNEGNSAGLQQRTYSSSQVFHAATLGAFRGRGTAASPAAVQSGDFLFSIDAAGQGSTTPGDETSAGRINILVDGTPGTNDMPGRIEFLTTADGAASPTVRVKINNAGITNLYAGAAVASAATITPTGNLFHVTGTTTITSVSGTNITAGTTITIIFDGALTFTDGSNLKLAGNFVTTADDTITLVYDGTNWYETARAVN